MLVWSLIGAGVAAGAALAWSRTGRPGPRVEWAPLLDAVAARHYGQATGGSTPSMRATIDELTVTLTLFDTQRGAEQTRAEADVALPNTDNILRLYVGWDAMAAPRGFEHVAEVDAASTALDGRIHLRSDAPDRARQFLGESALDLVDVRRETLAESVEVRVRGGYLQLQVEGVDPREAAIERLLRIAVRLARSVDRLSRATVGPGPA